MSEARPVAKGTVVKVLPRSKHYHAFSEGETVVSNGEGLMGLPTGDWTVFTNKDKVSQYLLPEHYEVLDLPVAASLSGLEKAKAVYAVVDANDDVKGTTADRDLARGFKAALGGKRKGIRIFQYNNAKEIR